MGKGTGEGKSRCLACLHVSSVSNRQTESSTLEITILFDFFLF